MHYNITTSRDNFTASFVGQFAHLTQPKKFVCHVPFHVKQRFFIRVTEMPMLNSDGQISNQIPHTNPKSFKKIDLNQLSKSQIPIFPQISNLLYANLKLNLKSLIGMQYLCYIVNLKFTPAIFYAVCANTQTVSKACVLFIVTHSVTGSVHNIGIVLHSKKNGFNCLCTQLYVINFAICRDLTSF